MNDDEFKRIVLERFDAMEKRFDAVDVRFDRVDRRIDAVAARMDDVENGIEAVAGRLALLKSTVNQVVEASTRALDSIATPSMRVTKLENPGE